VLVTISLFRHPCQSSAGIHPKKGKDGCPIKTVGHDRRGWIPDIGHPDPFGKSGLSVVGGGSGKEPRRIWLSRGIVTLGTDPSPLAQDDPLVGGFCHHGLFGQCLKGEI
jgi:hypothetical protein